MLHWESAFVWIKCGFDQTGSGERGGPQTGRAAWQQQLIWMQFAGLSSHGKSVFLQADGGSSSPVDGNLNVPFHCRRAGLGNGRACACRGL